MRKLLRNIMRAEAEKNHSKPSKAVNALWNRYQIKKRGHEIRQNNIDHGTHKKCTWPARELRSVS